MFSVTDLHCKFKAFLRENDVKKLHKFQLKKSMFLSNKFSLDICGCVLFQNDVLAYVVHLKPFLEK